MTTHGHALDVTVITVSDRAVAGTRADASGPAAVMALSESGHTARRVLIPDGADQVGRAVTEAIEAGADVVLTLGGTGLGPRDRTPEGVLPLLERDLPGVAEAIRERGRRSTPAAALSRGCAGVIGTTVVVTLPGAPGAVQESLEVLLPLLPHAHDQLAGGDH